MGMDSVPGKQWPKPSVVSTYQPVANKMGPQSMWNQHSTYFKDHDDHREPCAAFTANLVKEVKTWLEMGDQVVIGIDVNDDIWSCSFLVAM